MDPEVEQELVNHQHLQLALVVQEILHQQILLKVIQVEMLKQEQDLIEVVVAVEHQQVGREQVAGV